MLTYEKNETTKKLETYEWDNTWWDNRDCACEKDILVIGDSITVGYRHKIFDAAAKKWRVDGFASSKGIDNPYLIPSLDMFMAQQEKYDFILFNNGLHGWHLSAAEYGKFYKAAVLHLMEKAMPMALVLTTPVRVGKNLSEFDKRTEEIVKRNEEVRKIAAELSLPVIDLFSLILEKPELYSADGVHLTGDGYVFLAENIIKEVGRYS